MFPDVWVPLATVAATTLEPNELLNCSVCCSFLSWSVIAVAEQPICQLPLRATVRQALNQQPSSRTIIELFQAWTMG